MLLNDMYKNDYIFSVDTLIDHGLNKDTKLTRWVVEVTHLFIGLKTVSVRKITMSK